MAGGVRYKVRTSQLATRQLFEIADYISKASPQSAEAMIRRLVRRIEGLARLPHRFGVAPFGKQIDPDICRMVEWPYIVTYRIDQQAKTVDVLSIRHGKRRPEL